MQPRNVLFKVSNFNQAFKAQTQETKTNNQPQTNNKEKTTKTLHKYNNAYNTVSFGSLQSNVAKYAETTLPRLNFNINKAIQTLQDTNGNLRPLTNYYDNIAKLISNTKNETLASFITVKNKNHLNTNVKDYFSNLTTQIIKDVANPKIIEIYMDSIDKFSKICNVETSGILDSLTKIENALFISKGEDGQEVLKNIYKNLHINIKQRKENLNKTSKDLLLERLNDEINLENCRGKNDAMSIETFNQLSKKIAISGQQISELEVEIGDKSELKALEKHLYTSLIKSSEPFYYANLYSEIFKIKQNHPFKPTDLQELLKKKIEKTPNISLYKDTANGRLYIKINNRTHTELSESNSPSILNLDPKISKASDPILTFDCEKLLKNAFSCNPKSGSGDARFMDLIYELFHKKGDRHSRELISKFPADYKNYITYEQNIKSLGINS